MSGKMSIAYFFSYDLKLCRQQTVVLGDEIKKKKETGNDMLNYITAVYEKELQWEIKISWDGKLF